MANDTQMYGDIEQMRDKTAASDLFKCYQARFIEGDLRLAQELKEEFIFDYGYWDNWY